MEAANCAAQLHTAVPTRLIIETRYAQMFRTPDPAELERLRRLGETRTYGAGECEPLVATGETSPGMLVVLSGEVDVAQHDMFGRNRTTRRLF